METRHDGIFGDAPLGTDATHREDKYRSYDELKRVLNHFDTKGRPFSMSTVGTSNQGRGIDMVSVGRGNTDVLLVGHQHGNESTGSTSLLALLYYMASGKYEAYLDEVTVHVIPRANPDGAAIGFRGNVDPDAPDPNTSNGIFTTTYRGRGWDPNRYHFPDWTESRLYRNQPEEFPENPVPAARAVTEAVERVDPEWFLDIHGQSAKTTEDGEDVTHSLMWPVLGDKPIPENGLALSKRMCVQMYDHLSRFDQVVSRYPATAGYPGVAHKAYALQDRGSVIFESVEPQSVDQYRNRTLAALPSFMSLIGTTATGDLYDRDPERVEDIPHTR
ncbi:M14 family zinc carboxypeptidase [Natrinema soli]|uniref:M14 family zinc carboxypeptidase n=1 Tax=Natrinema soli TaxID=1930624 RepID=A0ABD5STJ2_9EURY|nr:M14 family zinc carboxypeptidase [Natrinema soli]